MKKGLFIVFALYSSQVKAQPLIDLGKFFYYYSPKSNGNVNGSVLRSSIYSFNLNLPIELKKGGDVILVNPFFDHNEGVVHGSDFNVASLGLFTGFLKKDIFKNCDLLTAFIFRKNKETGVEVDDTWQYGGLALVTLKKTEDRSLKFGLYYNREFFGNFFMPLVGMDWKLDSKNNLFGVLPGSMTWEHKISERFYYGVTFRALTNSYRQKIIDPCFTGDCQAKKYLRVDDNQLGVFADLYLAKKIVFTAETGYTILRKYRFGWKGDRVHIKDDFKSDNFYLRAGLAYRLRFR